jgi:hypothetical protein
MMLAVVGGVDEVISESLFVNGDLESLDAQPLSSTICNICRAYLVHQKE